MDEDYTDQKNRIKESDGLFYEIEYDASPMKGVGKFVLKSQPIKPPEKDEIRELFYRMRDISRQCQSSHLNHSRFFDRRVQQDIAIIFYKQAVFMQDFEDDYPEIAPFSAYFPYYQMLGYEQLRTYFTWRTHVRKGVVKATSLSYVFLYIYELLNNIGVDSPQNGLEQLLSFWTFYKDYDSSIDKYVIRWLKDYHIYYDLPQPFKDFAGEHHLTQHYPKMIDLDDSFGLFCTISKYDIRKSVFFTDETSKLITDCFNFIIVRIRQDFESAGIHFDDILFHPTKKLITWKPFKDALFFQMFKQPDRRVVISENEIYMCRNNEWTFSTMISSEEGRQVTSYVMRQMESVLRKITQYKFKITANTNMVSQETLNMLNQKGLSIEKIVETAVMEFYKELTKTVVTVDHAQLKRIRQEALSTQDTLIVEEHTLLPSTVQVDAPQVSIMGPVSGQNIFSNFVEVEYSNSENLPFENETSSVGGGWESLRDALSETQLQALAIILKGENIKKFSDNHHIMLEVLVDGINEKAMDTINDNILDDELHIYEEYEEQVKGMVES